ncbi:MAG: hypothetical protein K6D37_08510 [Prevotella sp.]|nr:hypothetical protein [Prevotella sp.]
MLCYQPDFFSPTQELTSDGFSQLIVSDLVVKTISEVRQKLSEADLAASRGEDPRPLLDAAQKAKRRLPKIVWQATFDETVSKKGNRGRWRKQSACRLNGLFMIDVDHVQQPEEIFHSWWKPVMENILEDGAFHQNGEAIAKWADSLGIVLVHVTPSGHGLRVVAKATMDGNLSDNQHRLASLLGVEADEACKDASRLSFCPGFEDILYMNANELFNYENPAYDHTFGPDYRRGDSSPLDVIARSSSATFGNGSLDHRIPSVVNAESPAPMAKAPRGIVAGESADDNLKPDDVTPKDYHGVPYHEIIARWFDLVNGGEPQVGDRHRVLLRLAADLRYICDNRASVVEAAIKEHPLGAAFAAESSGSEELSRIAGDACSRQLWKSIPKRFRPVLEALHLELGEQKEDAQANEDAGIDYTGYTERLLPLLQNAEGLREAVAGLPDNLKLAGVLAAGAMLGTYLTRCWWEHFDGKRYRLSYLVYIVGAAASGKSFLTDLDRLLMAPMLAADRVGRESERQWKEKQKQRKANEKLPDQPHPVIRYCPSTTSNAILYRRLQDAVDPNFNDPETNEPMHLHLITVESELATALRAQVGSWAGKNDLELKSFHNEKAGVDYANAESTNGIMQINWNQVISGTQESMSRKFKPATILDGLVTRVALFLMPTNDYQMIQRRRLQRNVERDIYLRQLGNELDTVKGELKVPRLVDFCYQYEEQLTRQARIEQDECLDYFRKRIPVIMMRYALVRIVLRQMDKAKKGEELEVNDEDLEFARLIGDWCLLMQVHLFGQMVCDALEKERQAFQPRQYRTKTRDAYNKLEEVFTLADVVKVELVKTEKSAYNLVKRWMDDDIVERNNNETWKKKIQKL